MSAFDSTFLHFFASEYNRLVTAAFGAAVLLATTAVYYSLSPEDNKHGFPKLPGIQLFHAWEFFQRRHDFIHSNFIRNPGQSFSFNVLHHKVIALTGEDARRVFYSDPRMNLSEGFKILTGAVPKPRDLRPVETETGRKWDIARFNKTTSKLMSKSRLQTVLPSLLEDIIGKADMWGSDGKSGRIDPFIEIFDLVFLMTARMATCRDLTNNEADLKEMGKLFSTLITGSTPIALLLPWFPSPAKVKMTTINIKMFLTLSKYVEARRQAEPTDDAIDVLIAEGETTRDIVQFVATVLFAGIANTGIISCWILMDLAVYPEWRVKCKKEIQELLSRHCGGSSSSAILYEKLSAIPISAWEDELPILDACTRESHRLAFSIISLRRNVGEDIEVGGKVVERGDFVAYPTSEVQLNPGYYPDPHKYDPGRWLRPDPVPNAAFPYLGWGAGRHPCPGMKVAKFEMKLITAMFLMRYEYELVDEDGNFPNPPPVPDRNAPQVRPIGSTVYLDFKKVME